MKNTNYPFLSSSGSINQMELKNRMILAPMGSNFAHSTGKVSEKLKTYIEARAKGGAGLIILETSSVSWPLGSSMPNMIGLSKDEFIPDLLDLTNRVHAYDSKIAAQLNQSGKVSQEDVVAGRPILVPSIPEKEKSDLIEILTQDEIATFVKSAGPDGKGPRYHELSLEEIDREIVYFVEAARRVKTSGFDALEIHAGHGYLISSFLSPSINRRKDKYGGSPQKRAKLLEEIIQSIRNEVGINFPILVRLDAAEFRLKNGLTTDDFIETAKIAENAGADALDVSAYGNSNIGIAFTEGPLVHEPGGFLEFAKLAKKSVKIPIIAVGRLELGLAEKSIQKKDFDFLALGRKLLADPDLPKKVVNGLDKTIRPCIYCYVCVSKIFINGPMSCAVNSSLGYEEEDQDLLKKVKKKLNVIIVGGGPAGMEVARLLSIQGHKISLWEKEKDLGGTARIAGLAYDPNLKFINYLKDFIKNSDVEIKLDKLATSQEIKSLNPDLVVIATGAIRNSPKILGKDLPHVFDGEQLRSLLFSKETKILKKLSFSSNLILRLGRASQLLRNIPFLRFVSRFWMPFSRNITIIGGDLVGLELAEFLTERRRKITILESTNNLGTNLSIVRRARLIHELKEKGVNLVLGARIEKINKTNILYTSNGMSHDCKADQVIIATGAESDNLLSKKLESLDIKTQVVGDCYNIGYIEGAIKGAREIARNLVEVKS
ncbi:MAG: FAD-dependent oxidoreductase [SAR86 cluster bacterium]|nr:FAD-dependent oxidoreductase [SAR86 cluster bacterium]